MILQVFQAVQVCLPSFRSKRTSWERCSKRFLSEGPIKGLKNLSRKWKELCLFFSVFVKKEQGYTGPAQQIEVWEDLDVVQFLSKTFFAYEVDCIAHVSVVRIGANLQKLW